MNLRESILLVDADPGSIAYLSSILSPHGEVRVARSADVVAGALAVGVQWRAAVVDLGAPDSWCGLDVIAELKRKHPGTPAMLLGGGPRPSAANSAYLLGVDYLEKPVDRACMDRFLISRQPLARKLELRAHLGQDRRRCADGWPSLIGRCTLQDHVESDGRRYALAIENVGARSRFEILSVREREVVRLAMSGHHGKSIAYEMGIAYSTVRVLKARVAAKLGVHGWREAIDKCEVSGLRDK